MNRREAAYHQPNFPYQDYFVGDDLTEEQLDELYRAVMEGEKNHMGSWWEDKPHQILYRLLSRLTRAEDKIGYLVEVPKLMV